MTQMLKRRLLLAYSIIKQSIPYRYHGPIFAMLELCFIELDLLFILFRAPL